MFPNYFSINRENILKNVICFTFIEESLVYVYIYIQYSIKINYRYKQYLKCFTKHKRTTLK